jgi:lipopolysaccharide/colanic/teichoic acid biosynthesis glycosyltransferase
MELNTVREIEASEVHVVITGREGYYTLKRILDFASALCLLVILSPLMALIALSIYVYSPGPIFFRQERVGSKRLRIGNQTYWKREDFTCYKFRTMKQNAEEDGEAKLAEKNDPRVTRVGDFLRKTRLDELPQFWNVLRGEMSLVGPRAERPELIAEFQKQVPFYRARLLVKPGLTGWAQINYGYYASVTEMSVKLEYDLYYIKHRTLPMDFQIILRTIGTVLRRTGR